MKSLIPKLQRRIFSSARFSSSSYWIRRYASGGNSGPGSYGRLAEFKASIINDFVYENKIKSVIEFGCGDGNQLKLADYPKYTGYDISEAAAATCIRVFGNNDAKEFFLADDYDQRKAELTLSLDVIFHLVEDRAFEIYMERLFQASSRFVIIYSSNTDEPIEPSSAHVRHRQFTNWVETYIPNHWEMAQKIPNAYPYDGDYQSTSFSDFYIYRRV